MEIVQIFFGISSFVITGTDDLLCLILFYIAYKTKFKEVILGTLLGLVAVMIPSFLFAKVLSAFEFSNYISVDIILGLALSYIAYGLIKDGIDGNDETEIHNLSEKTSLQVVTVSGITYFMNGLDDFVVYSGFYLKYEDKYSEIFYFSLGIILGLVLFALISARAGKIFLKLEEKFQNQIKIAIGIVVLLFAIYMIFFWKRGVTPLFSYFIWL